ncbi:MAG TPA: hypothetical protein VNS80_04960, partial [Pseudolysinimonas sp.]|nr:hypothetical protein [Pseudolysinimonas sp.]
MFKKFLAGLTAIALSLGMVALTAGPASAHHNTISVSVACNAGAEDYWKVTWSVTNSESDKTETITSSTDLSLVPVGTVIDPGATSTFVEYYTAKPAANKKLTLGAQWSNGVTNSDNETLKPNQFSDDCVPDTTDHKVWICHANNGNGTGGFVKNEVDVDSIIKDNGHAEHQNGRDIIPPFDYIKQGQAGSFAGLNWNPPYSQAFLDAGCKEPAATPAVPTFTEANCPAPGQVGQASYVIPTTTGIKYTVQINGVGGFVEQGANTYFVPAGTTVEVQAVALTGYVLGTPNYWSTTFQNKDCIVTVTPNPATFSVLECVAGVATQPSYTIPTTDGVKYTVRINGVGGFVEKSANTYNVSQGTTVEVKAVALTGYSLVGDEQWSKTFAVIDCDIAVAVQAVVGSDQECVIDDLDTDAAHYESGTITIPNTLHVTYSVNGIVKGAGEHDYAPGTYIISAVADSGY